MTDRGRAAPSGASPQSSTASPSSSPQSSAASPSSPASVTGPAYPIRLVYRDQKGKFRMDPEAMAVLRRLKGPIGVVSVWGCARLEKSLLLMQSGGYPLASTHWPRTEGLWLMNAPMKRTALDGTEYYLLRLDSELFDSNDQTETCSKQIFSLAVLLSSMFIYNQMGDIDEAALDRLSLLTEKTKDICVLASRGKSIASGLGHFSPIFVWLLRDLYSDSVEDNKRITAGDYLEHALRPVQGTGKDIAATNEIRRFIRALFPDRECFALVRPLNNGNDLQQLDSMDQLRPEFRSGLEALTEFVLERTRPKKVGASVLTGLVLVAITDSFLEACNNGENPTIASSWLIVEEGDCRGAYESATKVYISTFDRSKPLEEADMREVHEKALRASLAAFNSIAVDAGSARMRYEERLHKFFKRTFEEYKMKAFREADFLCSRAIQRMEVNLTTACHAPGVSIRKVVQLLGTLCSEYAASSHGPSKWQKLAMFLHESNESVKDLAKRLIDQGRSRKNTLMLTYRANEDQLELLKKQLEEKYKSQSSITIKSELKAAESIDVEIMSLKEEIRALSEELEDANTQVQYFESELPELRKTMTDGLALPHIKELTERGVWPVPTCFDSLPGQLKLEILKQLPVTDLCSIGCVSRGLRSSASDNNLWQSKFVVEFGVWSESGEMDWKKSFAESVKKKKRENVWRQAPFDEFYPPLDQFFPVFVTMKKDPLGNAA